MPTNQTVAGDAITGIPSCALDEPGLHAQRERYHQLAAAVSYIDRDRASILLEFTDQLDRDLLEHTLAIERECCAFFLFDFDESARRLKISVRERDQLPALDALAEAFAAGQPPVDGGR